MLRQVQSSHGVPDRPDHTPLSNGTRVICSKPARQRQADGDVLAATARELPTHVEISPPDVNSATALYICGIWDSSSGLLMSTHILNNKLKQTVADIFLRE